MVKLILFFIIIWQNSFASSCTELSRICIEGAETRIINNLEIHRNCWKYKIEYECSKSENYCEQFAENDECTQISTKCLERKDNICIKFSDFYQCDKILEEVELGENISLEIKSKITEEYLDESRCKHLIDDDQCILAAENCLESGNRDILGEQIFRECWRYNREYSCTSHIGNSNCAELEKRCQFSKEECAKFNHSNQCVSREKHYQCNSIVENKAVIFCGSQIYCENDDCNEIPIEENQDFANAATHLKMLEEMAGDFDVDALTIFNGGGRSCSKSAFGFNNCCKSSGWGNEIGFASCSAPEKELAELHRLGRCVYLGSYCSKEEKLTNICLKYRHNSCCFNSKLARIIQQQGRSQLGLNFGSAKHPNCAGLSEEQLAQIDFSEVDFSEVINEVMEDIEVPDSEDIGDAVSDRVEQFFEEYQNE